jgi:hypothetical protein
LKRESVCTDTSDLPGVTATVVAAAVCLQIHVSSTQADSIADGDTPRGQEMGDGLLISTDGCRLSLGKQALERDRPLLINSTNWSTLSRLA